MPTWIITAVLIFNTVVVVYFVLYNCAQMLCAGISAVWLIRHRRRRRRRARALVHHLSDPPGISLVVAAYNEELTIVESLRALLALDYPKREIVVVNDGSRDGTLALLQKTFRLVPAPLGYVEHIRTAAVRGVYRSLDEPDLVVIDKENGGAKADASNAGINAASMPGVMVLDADTILEPDALSRAVLPFLEDPSAIAVGAAVGIVNGSRVEAGRVIESRMPGNWLARFQVVEYLRAFLMFRLATAPVNAVPLLSGAFSLVRRDALLEAGGYDHTSIGEDLDLTVRLHRLYRERRRPYWIAYEPDPLCWTQAPEDRRSLRSQRTRWRRGLLQVLAADALMIGNPRYGTVGLLALPYLAFFDGLGPLLEIGGLVVSTTAALTGILNWHSYRVFLAASVLLGAASSFFAVLLNDLAFRRYRRPRDLTLLFLAAFGENLGYRQLVAWWGCVGTWQILSGSGGAWGTIKRKALATKPVTRV
jgi:cellulose synthase/poly-beta-1,6-N-acetylglucosamine synthase-like glycosyltransferase